MTSTTELTVRYIKEHPHIKHCLKKGLINYSALSRMIATELKIEKKSSHEAILIAARRYSERLKTEAVNEKKIRGLLSKSEIGIKNRISVIILSRNIDLDALIGIQKDSKAQNGILYLLEGSNNYTIITQDRYAHMITGTFQDVVMHQSDLAMIDFVSPEEIEKVPGVVSYLTSLFAENGVNIIEFLSCWRDTIFVIRKSHVNKALGFLEF
ncbi:MAG: DUF7523 family protein [Nanobdellota archaeon]